MTCIVFIEKIRECLDFLCFRQFKCFKQLTDFREILLQIRADFIFLANLTYCNSTFVNIIDVNSKGQVFSERNFGVFFPNNSQNFRPKVLIPCRFNDKIFVYHFLVPAEHKTSLLHNIYRAVYRFSNPGVLVVIAKL